MKKYGIIFAAVLVVVLLGISGHKVYAATWPTFGGCDSTVDDNHFPYHFLCGSDNGDTVPSVHIDRTGTTGDHGNGGVIPLSPTDSVDFTAGFTSSGPSLRAPGTPANVLVWVYVLPTGGDTNIFKVKSGNYWNSITNTSTVSGVAGTPDQCPGWGSKYGKVFNYVGTKSDPNKSPAAWDGGGQGFENCHDYGAMVRWKIPPVGSATGAYKDAFKFRVNLDKTVNGGFCVREIISIDYGESDWPGPSPGDGNSGDQNHTANRVAKQSNQVCYNMKNTTPSASSFAVSCKPTYFTINGAQDPDHPGSPVEYRIARINQSGSGITYETNSAPTDSLGNAYSNYAIPVNGRNYTIKIRDIDTGNWYTPTNAALPQTVNYAPCTTAGTASCTAYAPATAKIGENPAITVSFNNESQNTDWRVGVFDSTSGGVPQAYDQHSGAQTSPGGIAGQFQILNEDYTSSGGSNLNMLRHGHTESPAIKYVQNSPAGPGEVVYTFSIYNDAYASTSNPEAGWFNGNKAICSATITWVAPGKPPVGNIDAAICHTLDLNGWAADPDSDALITVDIYYGRTGAESPDAHLLEKNYPTGPDHRFNYSIPASLQDAYNYTFRVIAHDDGSGDPPAGDTALYGGTSSTPNLEMAGCGHFKLTAKATGSLDNDEDPTTYRAINDSGIEYPGWAYPTKPEVGGSSTNNISKDGLTIKVGPGDNSFGAHTQTFEYSPITDPQAGQLYCSNTSVISAKGDDGQTGSEGLINTSGHILAITNTNPAADSTCSPVKNKPFFKVLGGNVSAGGEFESVGGCVNPANEGILAGYNNNTYDGYDFGSSTELTALALRRITGVASGQTKYDRGVTSRSFANTVVSTPPPANGYDPWLGGNFNAVTGSAINCLTVPDPDPELTSYPINDGSINSGVTADKKVKFTHGTGTLTLNASSIPAGKNVSIFTEGRVVITGNLTYAPGTWNKDNVPSLVIHAGGDILIDASVGTLDGMYIAEKSGSKIYTCTTGTGNAAQPMAQNTSYYNDCGKQLTIHGSFVADRVNLMRTFGTMRDEKPKVTTPSSQLGVYWTEHADSSIASTDADGDSVPDLYCANVNEHWDPSDKWADNWLCVPSSKGIKLAWTCNAWSSFTQSNAPIACDESLASIKSRGYNHCLQWLVTQDPDTWSDDWLCWSGGDDNTFTFHVPANNQKNFGGTGGPSPTADPTKYCTAITESSDPEWPQAYLCEAKADPGGLQVPTSITCSNDAPGRKTFNYRTVAGMSAGTTCAAEVFDFSPEQYLSHPAITPPNNGAMVWDSVTSLPPVL